MRFGITLLLVSISVFGCSAAKVEEKQVAFVPHIRIETPGSGIALRKFKIIPKSDITLEVLNNFGTTLQDSNLQERLESEGMFVRVVDAIDIPAIAASLGESREERYDWHGQIIKWRDILQRKMPSSGMLVTAGGISHFVDHGYLTLLARGWQIGMESCDQFYVQLLPVWHVPAERGVIPGKNITPIESRIFSELMIECLLQDRQALLIVSQMDPVVQSTGPFDEGPAGVRIGEALMGGPVEEPIITFMLFEVHVGVTKDI
ncbi:MAG TPA: hypothetical protein QF528_03310 [Phycisphaerales bacterium]|nr:hypothetical protein [Phycisphaerales bacterium]